MLLSLDYQPFIEMYFVIIRLLGKAERISQYRVSRSMTVVAWKEGKRRTVACRLDVDKIVLLQ